MPVAYNLSVALGVSNNGTAVRGTTNTSVSTEYTISSATITYVEGTSVYFGESRTFNLTLNGGVQVSRFQNASAPNNMYWRVDGVGGTVSETGNNTYAIIAFDADYGTAYVYCVWDDGYNNYLEAGPYTIEVY